MWLSGHLVLLGTQFRDFSGIGYKYSKLQQHQYGSFLDGIGMYGTSLPQTLEYCQHESFVIYKDYHYEFSASTKCFSIIVCTFYFMYKFFVFPLIFIYHLVFYLYAITIQFINTISISKIFFCNIVPYYVKVN